MERVRPAHTVDELIAQFQHISAQAADLANRFPQTAFDSRPSPKSWSAAECLAHLNLSSDPYLPLWRAETPRLSRATRDHYKLDLWGRILIWTLEPPPRFRFPAPSKFLPVDVVEPVLPAFLERHNSILQLLDSARGLAMDSVKITSPFDARVHYSIWSSFCVTAAHERRHLRQAERALLSQAATPM